MSIFEKHFTAEEANAMLPYVRQSLDAMRVVAEDLAARRVDMQRRALANSTGAVFDAYTARANEFVRLLEDIRGRGVLVKDLSTGLVDFPAWRDGEEVLLCWREGEDEIVAWHDLQSGFAGRQPLE